MSLARAALADAPWHARCRRAHLSVSRLTEAGPFGRAGVLVTLPRSGRASQEELMAQGLTAAEALVATSLAHGLKPAEIARERDVSLATVRSQIRAIYEKLEVSSASQLLLKLGGLL